MKKIALLMLITSNLAAQNIDSLTARINALETEQARMKDELTRSHEKFRLGAIITGVGLLMVGYEAVTYATGGSDLDNDGYDGHPTFAYIGAGLMIAGGIVMVDSHRHIGLAGRSDKPTKTWKPFQIKKRKSKT
jgi:hypothetical protein